MPKYTVYVREYHLMPVEIEAESEEEAIEKVESFEGDYSGQGEFIERLDDWCARVEKN